MISIIKKALAAMPNINKPQKSFITHLLSIFVVFQGKATFKNLSRYSHRCEKTFNRYYQKTFDYLTFNTLMLKQQLTGTHETIAAVDASFIPKSGKHTDGLGKFWRGCAGRSEKGLEISVLSIIDIKSNTAYALNAKQTIDENNKTRVDLYAEHILEASHKLKELNIKHLAVDSYYSKKKFVLPVMKTGLHLISKLRGDADLLWPWEGKYSGKGRPRIYDGKVNIDNDLQRFTFVGTSDEKTLIYEARLYSRSLKSWIRVVLLRFQKGNKMAHAFLYSTDLELDPLTLIKYYKARFQIEFFFRDAKQYTGLTDCQARNKEAINFHINASCSALNTLKLEDRKKKGTEGKTVISIDSWKRMKFNQHLMDLVFSKLGLSMNNEKVRDVYTRFSGYGSIAA
tara:strand:+ start:113 stop:1306 length:1194 start_codon:yes stop_codon:yes gene_type:complete